MNQAPKVRIAVVDDDPIVRQAIRACIECEPDMLIVGEYADGKAASLALRDRLPDVLLLDILMPGMNGIEVLRSLASQSTVHALVLCSSLTSGQVLEILELGGRGAISKQEFAQLIPAIRAIVSGRYWVNGNAVSNVVHVLSELREDTKSRTRPYQLTLREMQIIRLITEGMTNRDIGLKLSITEETVKRHLTNIFEKVGMSNRLELAMFAINHNLVWKG